MSKLSTESLRAIDEFSNRIIDAGIRELIREKQSQISEYTKRNDWIKVEDLAAQLNRLCKLSTEASRNKMVIVEYSDERKET